MGLTSIFTSATIMNTLGSLGFDDNAPAAMLGRASEVGGNFSTPKPATRTFG